MMVLPLTGPFSGTMLAGFPCLQNIWSRQFLKDHWWCLLIVNGFGIVTGSIHYGTNLTVKNFMERSSITLMLYPLSMEFVKGKLKKFGIDSIHMSVMTWIWLSQKLSMKKIQPLRNVRTMIWCRQLKGRALSFIRFPDPI
uniref:Uncharacterized protein n=1 Tax=Populus trichocarpa x Populus deltoides TaxID=3695 RepID=A9PIM8_9ROSI|nr:unknown [Populus trichocarpa x Populus deltoides]